MAKIVVALTGASGSIFALELLKLTKSMDVEVHGLISAAGEKVLGLECGLKRDDLPGVDSWFDVSDFTAPMASGSCGYEAMAVLPCTMGSLSAIACGSSINLIHRAADVMLKERRPLVLGVRESPLNRIHLENMLKAHDAGATIMPPVAAFYHRPKSLTEMARDYACRVLTALGLEVEEMRCWQGGCDV